MCIRDRDWQSKACVPPDRGHNRYFEVDTALLYLDTFIRDVYKRQVYASHRRLL